MLNIFVNIEKLDFLKILTFYIAMLFSEVIQVKYKNKKDKLIMHLGSRGMPG